MSDYSFSKSAPQKACAASKNRKNFLAHGDQQIMTPGRRQVRILQDYEQTIPGTCTHLYQPLLIFFSFNEIPPDLRICDEQNWCQTTR